MEFYDFFTIRSAPVRLVSGRGGGSLPPPTKALKVTFCKKSSFFFSAVAGVVGWGGLRRTKAASRSLADVVPLCVCCGYCNAGATLVRR